MRNTGKKHKPEIVEWESVAPGVTFYQGGHVRHRGKTYVCVIKHTKAKEEEPGISGVWANGDPNAWKNI